MGWRQRLLLVEAMPSWVPHDTHSTEDLGTRVTFPKHPKCSTHCKRLVADLSNQGIHAFFSETFISLPKLLGPSQDSEEIANVLL